MLSNNDAIKLFNEMAKINNSMDDNCYFSSGRPVKIDPKIIVNDVNSKLKLKEDDLLLDIGCGTGVITIPLSYKVKEVYALDGGTQVIKKLKENSAKNNVFNIKMINLPFNKKKFQDNFFDKILMYGVIHYFDGISAIENCLKELIRICKPGGTILVAEIPEKNAIEKVKNHKLSQEEKELIKIFESNRTEYDVFMNKIDMEKYNFMYQELNGDELLEICNKFDCHAEILKQDVRQPFSITRRDLLIKLKK